MKLNKRSMVIVNEDYLQLISEINQRLLEIRTRYIVKGIEIMERCNMYYAVIKF